MISRPRAKSFVRRRGDLLLRGFAQTTNGGANSDGTAGVEAVSTTRLRLVAPLAAPDTNGLTLHAVLAAEVAEELGVLGHFLLLDDLTEGGTVTGAVLAHNAYDSERKRLSVNSWVDSSHRGARVCARASRRARSIRQSRLKSLTLETRCRQPGHSGVGESSRGERRANAAGV